MGSFTDIILILTDLNLAELSCVREIIDEMYPRETEALDSQEFFYQTMRNRLLMQARDALKAELEKHK